MTVAVPRPDTLVLITGATSGLGAALAETVPYTACRIVNISRRSRADTENLTADLADPADWRRIRAYLRDELAAFTGSRVLFVHNAAELTNGTGWAGEVEAAAHEAHVLVNAAAPLVLGEAFLAGCRSLPPEVDAGLVVLSSTASTSLPVTRAVYGAGKAGVEQWVRAVREERRVRGTGPWVIAILPGGMDTPGLRAAAGTPDEEYPRAAALRIALANGLIQAPEVVARSIWAALPPAAEGADVVRVGPSHAVDSREFTR
jgi:short-subunit dehydrogenase